MTGDVQLLRAADFCLSKCGRVTVPNGLAAVDLYAGLFFQVVVPNQGTVQNPVEITGDTPFFLRCISGIQAPTLAYIQVQFPDGKYLQQTLRQWNQDSGVGSNRFLVDPEVQCPPGTKIYVTADTSINNPGSAQPVSLLFEGAYRYYLKDTAPFPRIPIPAELTATLPRIFSSRIQNIMAPRWMSPEFAGEGDKFFYVSQQAAFAVPTAGGGSNSKVITATEAGYEFFLQRFYAVATFDTTNPATSGTPYVRIREGSGRELTDDYVNLSRLSGQALPTFWRIPPGRDIIVDLLVMDSSGAGNINVQYWFDGYRRRVK